MKNFLKYLEIIFPISLIAMITFCIFFHPEHKQANINMKVKSLKTTSLKKIELRVEPVAEEVVEEPAPQPQPEVQLDVVETPSLDTQVGTMSAYGPDCAGCSGNLASGRYVGDGNIYYEDPTYGTVRIVAADREYPIGSIVKVSGSRLGDFNAIVLDRGGGIGFGKRFLFDLLFASEAEASGFGTSYNVTFDLLRSGY